jgi:thiol-disulfide isomerase/thioredoxin
VEAHVIVVLSAAVVLLWLVVLVLSCLTVLLYRQFGLLYIGSRGRVALTGLAVGTYVPGEVDVESPDHEPLHLRWADAGEGRATTLIFGSPTCPLCETLLEELGDFAGRWHDKLDVVFVDRYVPGVAQPRRPNAKDWTHVLSENGYLHSLFDATVNPYAFIVDVKGAVVAKGIVNDSRGLDALAGEVFASANGADRDTHDVEAVPAGV